MNPDISWLFFSFQQDDDGIPDFANMTEEEQIAFAMQMSMQDARKFTINPTLASDDF